MCSQVTCLTAPRKNYYKRGIVEKKTFVPDLWGLSAVASVIFIKFKFSVIQQ